MANNQPAAAFQPTFIGGVQDYLPKHMIDDNAAARLENIDVADHGTVRRRGGLREFSVYQAGVPAGSKMLLTKSIPANRDFTPLLVSMRVSELNDPTAVFDGGTGVIQITPSNEGTFLSFDDRLEIINILERIYFLQPGQPARYYEAGATRLKVEIPEAGEPQSTIPSVGTAAYFQARMWAGGDDAKPDLVWFSTALGSTEANASGFTWDQVAQSFRVVTGKVEKILGFRNVTLIVFTDHGIESIEPDACSILNSIRSTITDVIGCVNKHTVQVCGEDVLFMDQNGHIRSLKQTELDESAGVTNLPLSQTIANVIDRQTKEYLRTARSQFFNGSYYIWFPTDSKTYANEGWRYSFRERAWMGPYLLQKSASEGHLNPIAVGGMAAHKFNLDHERLYFTGKSQAGDLKSWIALDEDDFDDDGVKIPIRLETKAYQPLPGTRKIWQHMETEVRFIHSDDDASIDVDIETRVADTELSEEKGWLDLGTETLNPDAEPHLPVHLPFTLVPYGRQRIKKAMTSQGAGHSYGCQFRFSMETDLIQFELILLLLTGHPKTPDYAR